MIGRPSQRFPRSSRLTRKHEFDAVLQRPALRVRHGRLRACVCPNALGAARLGIIVGRRQAGNSVRRNRLKRRIRESFRLNQCRLGGVDVVVQVAAAPVSRDDTSDREAIAESLAALWQQICDRWQPLTADRGTLR